MPEISSNEFLKINFSSFFFEEETRKIGKNLSNSLTTTLKKFSICSKRHII